jgi:ribonuclease HI
MCSRFSRIGGTRINALPLLSIVQCDGSYSRRGAAAAFFIYDTSNQLLKSQRIDLYDVKSSTEAEWASVYHGMEAALEDNNENIGLENDCLAVIAGLVFPTNKLRNNYAKHYRTKILSLAEHTLWTGARWIPRSQNRADDLFRKLL